MTYTILAIVVLVVVVLFVLMSRKPEATKPGVAEKGAESKAKSVKPAAAAPVQAHEPTKGAPSTPMTAAAAAAPGPAAPPAPMRDLSELRKGLAKARGQAGFLGRLASLFAGKKDLDPNIADEVEEILLTSDVGVATTQTILARLREGLEKHELSSSQAVWNALRAEAVRILGIGGGKIDVGRRPTVVFMASASSRRS